MPFPRRLLDDEEEVVLDLRRHWLYLVAPSATLAGAIAVVLIVSTWTNRGVVLIPLLLAVLSALGWFLLRVADWAGTNLAVTNQRVVMRTGLLRRGQELALGRVDDIRVTQTLTARMLGAGDLVIESAGERGAEVFLGCPHPKRVRDTIHHQRRLVVSRITEPTTGRLDMSPLGQLERLDELRRRGAISQAEFDAKKTQLLGRL